MVEGEAILLKQFSHKADAQAFAELVHHHAQLVYGTAWRILRDQNEAADVTQETFIALYQQAGHINIP